MFCADMLKLSEIIQVIADDSASAFSVKSVDQRLQSALAHGAPALPNSSAATPKVSEGIVRFIRCVELLAESVEDKAGSSLDKHSRGRLSRYGLPSQPRVLDDSTLCQPSRHSVADHAVLSSSMTRTTALTLAEERQKKRLEGLDGQIAGVHASLAAVTVSAEVSLGETLPVSSCDHDVSSTSEGHVNRNAALKALERSGHAELMSLQTTHRRIEEQARRQIALAHMERAAVLGEFHAATVSTQQQSAKLRSDLELLGEHVGIFSNYFVKASASMPVRAQCCASTCRGQLP